MLFRMQPRGVVRRRLDVMSVVICLLSAGVGMVAVQGLSLTVQDGETKCILVAAKAGDQISGNFEVTTPVSKKHVAVVLRMDDEYFYKKQGAAEAVFLAEATKSGDYELCFVNGDEDELTAVQRADLKAADGLQKRKDERKKMLKALADLEDKDKKAEKNEKDAESDSANDDGLLDRFYGAEEPSAGYDDGSWYAQEYNYKTFGFNVKAGKTQSLGTGHVSEDEQRVAVFMRSEAEELREAIWEFSSHNNYERMVEEAHREEMGKMGNNLLVATLVEAAVLVWVSWTSLSYITRFFETKRVL